MQKLQAERDDIFLCMEQHPYYQRASLKSQAAAVQGCVDFFDRRLTFHVLELTHQNVDPEIIKTKVASAFKPFRLGGSPFLFNSIHIEDLDLGETRPKLLLEANQRIWNEIMCDEEYEDMIGHKKSD